MGIGRYPANIIHDGSEEVVNGFPHSGPSSNSPRNNKHTLASDESNIYSKGKGIVTHGHKDNGGSAARFFQKCENIGELIKYIEKMIKSDSYALITEEIYEAEFFENLYNELSPGAHLATVFWSKQPHRLIMAIEDAGFEIRDIIVWITKNGNLQIPLARKPLEGTVAENVMKYGCGGINIDGCRIAIDSKVDDPRLGGNGTWKTDKMAKNVYEGGYSGTEVGSSDKGRYPANIIHDGSSEVLTVFPHTNPSKNGGRSTGRNFGPGADVKLKDRPRIGHDDNGGSAARFFQTCKNLEEVRAYIEKMIKC